MRSPDTFTQIDPIGLRGGLNLYGFAGGDPVNFSDPFGLRDIRVEGQNSRKIVAYLYQHSKTFRETYDRLNNDKSVQLTIRDAHDPERAGVGDNRFVYGGGRSGTIRFNDVSLNQANRDLFSSDPGSSWMFTAGSVMAHEMAHADAYLGAGPEACKSDQNSTCAIEYENEVRAETGNGGERTRYSTTPGQP
jgi:hypothetical protein